MRKLLQILLFICCSSLSWAQVKVGDNINTIDAASILELESSEKVFVVTRMTTIQINTITPLNGALVYDIDQKCLFVFEGTLWKNLCDSEITVTTATTAPANSTSGDIWFNDTNSTVNIWNGSDWVSIPKTTWSGNGTPNAITAPNPVSGNIYVDFSTGDLYTYDGNNWIDQTIKATNGINKTSDKTLELGGALTKATEIATNNTNTLAVTGLETATNNTNAIVTVEESTGILRKTPFSSFLQQEEIVIIANDAQTQFTPPLLVTSSKKINVYRNGVKLGFTVINDSTIELETNVVCYQNDEIRIVQFY